MEARRKSKSSDFVKIEKLWETGAFFVGERFDEHADLIVPMVQENAAARLRLPRRGRGSKKLGYIDKLKP